MMLDEYLGRPGIYGDTGSERKVVATLAPFSHTFTRYKPVLNCANHLVKELGVTREVLQLRPSG